MKKLFLLRHGLTSNNRSFITQPPCGNVEICDKQAPARHAKQNIETLTENGTKACYIFFSPALRARQTVEPLCNKKRIYSMVEPSLIEVDFGDFAGQHENRVIDGKSMQDHRDDIVNGTFECFPNGEHIDTIERRCEIVRSVIDKVPQDCNVCLVGHNRFFRHLMVALGVWDKSNMFEAKFPHDKLFHVDI